MNIHYIMPFIIIWIEFRWSGALWMWIFPVYITSMDESTWNFMRMWTDWTLMKNAGLWNVALCSSCENRCFSGMCLLHLQSRKNLRAKDVGNWLARPTWRHIPEDSIVTAVKTLNPSQPKHYLPLKYGHVLDRVKHICFTSFVWFPVSWFNLLIQSSIYVSFCSVLRNIYIAVFTLCT
jgi:hypothetical protein